MQPKWKWTTFSEMLPWVLILSNSDHYCSWLVTFVLKLATNNAVVKCLLSKHNVRLSFEHTFFIVIVLIYAYLWYNGATQSDPNAISI